MTELEKLANEIMTECEKEGEPVTLEEAKEMAQMELDAKQVKRYEQSDKPRKKKTVTRKVDEAKVEIIATIAQNLTRVIYSEGETDYLAENIVILKPEREITFTLNGDSYSITLTKHRPKKQGGGLWGLYRCGK